ncbi:MAG: biopolymer transporter ExbD [Muribaculaceae bacterium]|nr:biopolymer transporter ExbD [Muribaculaceae bacterium]
MEVNICPKCGNIFNGSEKYCSNCGAKLLQEDGADQQSFKANKTLFASKRRKNTIVLLLIAALVIFGSILAFFMLTSTFLEKEPVQVITPPSLSEENVPEEKFVQILIAPDGKVYLSLAGTRDESVLPSEKFREEVLTTAYELYRNDNPNAEVLTPTQITEFGKIGTFGVPMNKLLQWLDMSTGERDEMLRKEGIPIEITKDHPNSRTNEFQYWLSAIKQVFSKYEIDKYLRDGNSIVIKAEQDTAFDKIHVVMENLQSAHLNKFILMTSFKSEMERE